MTNKKKEQRTKGNVKPSSSGRSSQLLAEAGVTNIGAFSFSSSIASTASNDPAVDESAIDSEIRAVFDRLGKKDSTTKLKALQKLHDICSDELRTEDVKVALPFWPRHYCRLVTDNDRRVRECAQIAHQGVVEAVGRDLSKIFKTIAGVWFVSQSDPYAPAATSGILAFQTAFPDQKGKDALVYAQKEILDYIQDLLLVQTVKSLSDNKTSVAEDPEQRYERMIVAALTAYASLLERVSLPQLTKSIEVHKSIFQDPKFWKISKQNSPKVQHAWFGLLSGLCQHMPSLANQFGPKLVPAVFLTLDAEDPTVLPAVWICALFIIKNIENCWSYLSIQKSGVLNKLKKLAKEGCFGCAMQVMPSFVILLNRIPLELLGKPELALEEICDSIRESFTIRRVQLSPSEVAALVSALVDIFQLAIKTYHSDQEFCRRLLDKEIISVLKDSIANKPVFLSNSHLGYALADKLEIWAKASDKYENVLNQFWMSVSEMCHNILNAHMVQDGDSAPENTPESGICEVSLDLSAPFVIERVAELLCTLHSPDKYKRRRSTGKVRFKSSSGSGVFPEMAHANTHGYDKELANIVVNLCKTAVSFSSEHRSKSLARFLSLILRDFASETLFRDIYTSEENGTALFLKNFCLPILRGEHADGELLFLNVLFVLPEDGRLSVLEEIAKTESQTDVLLIVKTLLDGHQSDTAVNRWLCSEEVSSLLLLVAESVTSPSVIMELTNQERWELIRGALTAPEQGCCVLNISVITKILEKFTECLSSENTLKSLGFLQAFLTSLASAIESSVVFWSSLDVADSFLIAVLRASCNPRYGIDTFVKGQVLSIWSISLEKCDDIRYKSAIDVVKDIFTSCVWSVSELEDIIASYDFIIGSLVDNWVIESDDLSVESPCLLGRMKGIFEFVFPPYLKDERQYSETCFVKVALSGVITVEISESEVSLTAIQEAYVCSSLLKKYARVEPKESPPATREEIMKTRFVADSDDDSGSEKNESVKEIEKYDLENFEHVFQNIQLAYSYATLIHDQIIAVCEKIPNFETVQPLRDLLKSNMVQLFSNLEQIQQKRILAHTLNDSRIHGFLYTFALDHLLDIIGDIDTLEVKMKELVDIVEIESVGDLQTYEILVGNHAQQYAKDVLFQCSGSVAEAGLRNSMSYVALLSKCLQVLGSEPGGEDGVAESSMVVLERLEKMYTMEKSSFLGDCDLGQEKTHFVTIVARFYTSAIQSFATSIRQHHTVMMCLVGWIKSLKITFGKHISRKQSTQIPVHVLSFASAVASLYGAVCRFTEKTRTDPDAQKVVSSLLNDWTDIYRDAVCDTFWPLVCDLLRLNETSTCSKFELFIASISSEVICTPVEKMVAQQTRDDGSVAHATLRKLLPLLSSKKRANQITSYRLAKRLIGGVVDYDESHPLENADGSENNSRPIPTCLTVTLKSLAEETNMLIGSARPGDELDVDPTTLHTLEAYILAWELVLDLTACATSELRSQYAAYLQESGILRAFLDLLFIIIPQRVLSEKEVGGIKTAIFVADELALSVFDPFTTNEVEHAACRVFSHALRQLPAAVRQWYTATDKNLSGLVERFTTRYISALLCAEEMKAVQTANTTFTNMTIRVRPSVREVVASYTIDDASMELIVKLPPHHPLGQIVVEGGRKVGIAQAQWRNWMLQLTTFLIHQNGSIYDGLLLWKRNADKRFEGLEECYICYYILHGSSYQLPKLQCKTCRKKFHADCLYKWFNTSNNSTCPLCRNLF